MKYLIIIIQGNLMGFDIKETVRKNEYTGQLLRVAVEEQ